MQVEIDTQHEVIIIDGNAISFQLLRALVKLNTNAFYKFDHTIEGNLIFTAFYADSNRSTMN